MQRLKISSAQEEACAGNDSICEDGLGKKVYRWSGQFSCIISTLFHFIHK